MFSKRIEQVMKQYTMHQYHLSRFFPIIIPGHRRDIKFLNVIISNVIIIVKEFLQNSFHLAKIALEFQSD